MAIEIVGIEIGDYVAIAALTVSMFTFWFGYVKSKKSEQFQIAREIMMLIEEKQERMYELMKVKDSLELLKLINSIGGSINYFTYLIDNDEIRDITLLSFYLPGFSLVLNKYDDLVSSLDAPQDFKKGVISNLRATDANVKKRIPLKPQGWENM